MLGINKDFMKIDDSTNWFSANVTGSQLILFRMPAFPYALWPWLKGSIGEEFMKIIQEQVPEPVQKAMNHAHSVFAPDADTSQSMETLSRRWKYFLLDFTAIKDVGELSSKVLFADAGDREVLDYDVIEVPVSVDEKGDIVHSEYLLGFKVGCRDLDGEGGGCKVACQAVKKSVLANKFASRKRLAVASSVFGADEHMSAG